MKKTYLIAAGILVVVILIIVFLPSPSASSPEQQAIDACVKSGGAYDVTTRKCIKGVTGTKPTTSTTTTTPPPKTNPPVVTPPVTKPLVGATIAYSPASAANEIHISTPLAGSVISAPFVIRGDARGAWYFEASFPVILLDSKNNIIASGSARAIANWMTENQVPFELSLSFTHQTPGSKGTLILKNDNPSGDPAREKTVTIPVVFK